MSICSVHLIQFYKSNQLLMAVDPAAGSVFSAPSEGAVSATAVPSVGAELFLAFSSAFAFKAACCLISSSAISSDLLIGSYSIGFGPIGLSQNSFVTL